MLLIYVALILACGEDSGLDGVFANKPFALVTAADGGRTSISAVIDERQADDPSDFRQKAGCGCRGVDVPVESRVCDGFSEGTGDDDGPDATPNRDGQLGSRGGLLRNLSPERNSGLVGLFPVSRETDRGSD